MRLGIFRRRWSPHGGAERFAARFMAALAEAGHDVHLFAASWEDGAPGVTVHRVPVAPGPAALQALTFAWSAPRAARAAGMEATVGLERTLDQDVYRAGEGCHRQWLELRRRARAGRGASLDRCRPHHAVVLALERRLCQGGGARVVVVNSRLVAEGLRRHYAPLAPALALVRNAVDPGDFHPEVRARHRAAARRALGLGPEPVLLLLGSGFERKGVPAAVRALARLGRGGPAPARLLVAGHGRAGAVQALARREGVADRVRLLGPVADPLPCYAAADVFVLPSLYDPASSATLEALAMGLPVVTTRTNGASELIEPGRSGWVVDDPLDAAALAAALGEACDPAAARRAGEAGRAAVAGLTWERCVAETLRVVPAPGGRR